jgi:hypothetical protein
MGTYVVAGGTTGMGRGLALHFLRRGDRVTVVGSDPAKGRLVLDEAARMGAGDRAAFIQADLTSVAANVRVIEEVKARHDALDGLVLTAIRHFSRRVETPDGVEATFALYYVSRFLLSYGLTDLLGVAYAANHPDGRTRYLLHHPGFTDSGTSSLKQPTKTIIKLLAKLMGQPVEKSIQPIIELMDDPPGKGLLAYDRRTPVDPSLPTLDPENARRLYELTRHLLG